MKKVLVKILGIFLIIVCLLGLYLSIISIGDIDVCREYWEKNDKEALESICMLEDSIGRFREDQIAYLDDVEAFEEKLEAYALDKQSLEQGGAYLAGSQRTYNENAQKLAEAQTVYNEGVIALEQGRKEVEEGRRLLAANEQAYNAGKAQLAQIEPIYSLIEPLYNAYLSSKAEYDAAVAAGDTEKAEMLYPAVSAADALVSKELAGSGYSIGTLMSEVSAAKAKLKEYEDGLAKVQAGEQAIAEGEAKLAESAKLLEENDAKLAAAKNQLNASYASYAAGQAQLEDGAAQLEDGKTRLAVYEDDQKQIIDSLNRLISTETYRDAQDRTIVKSIASRLGKDYTYWAEDEDGSVISKNDEKLVDLDNAFDACTAGRDFVDSTDKAVEKELRSRFPIIVLAALASVLGILAGTMGLCEGVNGSGFVGLASALTCFAGVVAALFMGGVEYPMSRIAGCTGTSYAIVALIVIAVSAAIYTTAAFFCYESRARSAVALETAVNAEE